MEESLLNVVPDSARRAYDVKKVIAAIVDHGRFLELKPGWARNLVTALARLGGRPVGIVANQPMVQDVPGFLVGSKVERQGILRHGAKMLYAVSEKHGVMPV